VGPEEQAAQPEAAPRGVRRRARPQEAAESPARPVWEHGLAVRRQQVSEPAALREEERPERRPEQPQVSPRLGQLGVHSWGFVGV
jgi:hypothetical protein